MGNTGKKVLFQQKLYTISSIYTLVVGNSPYAKRRTSQNEPMLVEVKYLRLKRTSFTPIFFVHVPDQFDAFFNPKNASEEDAKNNTPPSIGQLEKRTSSRATDVV